MNQNNTEVIDILAPEGTLLGTMDRMEAHIAGHWHNVFHCLVVRSAPPARVVLQRRHRLFRTFANRIFISVSGHMLSGETPTDGVREIYEELGIEVALSQLIPLGVRLMADTASDHNNRERIHAFLACDDRPLEEFNPGVDEVEALLEAKVTDLLELLEDPNATALATQWKKGTTPIEIEISVSDLVDPIDGYFAVMLIMAERLVNGERHLAI